MKNSNYAVTISGEERILVFVDSRKINNHLSRTGFMENDKYRICAERGCAECENDT